jgi:uncharacterized protein YfaP (DUF2135 family)
VRRVALAILTVACGRAALAPAPPPASPELGVIVTLRWTAGVDLDLYVTDPARESVYFANPHAASGGVLERDARCADGAGAEHVERVRWTDPPPGRYRVGVDFPEACDGGSREAPWTLTVDVDGVRRVLTGRARLAQREPAVLEFTVVPKEDR